jgi:hypothetical protein
MIEDQRHACPRRVPAHAPEFWQSCSGVTMLSSAAFRAKSRIFGEVFSIFNGG